MGVRKLARLAATVALSSVFSGALYAHHGNAAYENAKEVTIMGTVPPENSVQPTSLQTNCKVSSGLQPSLSQVNEIRMMQMQACATEQSSDAVKGPSRGSA
jgi:hypothetical protein